MNSFADGRKLAIPPPLFTRNLTTNNTVIQMIADYTVASVDVVKHAPKRLKLAPARTSTLCKIGASTDADSEDDKSDNFLELSEGTIKLNKRILNRRRLNRSTTKRSHSDNFAKSSKLDGQRSKGQNTGSSSKDIEEDDLLNSYLQARDKSDEYSSRKESLWDAMQSQKW